MRIVWIGGHEEGLLAFRQIVGNENIAGFITYSDSIYGKRSGGTRRYKDICEHNKIPYFEVETIKDARAEEIISSLRPDLLIVLGWSEILPSKILEIPTIGTIGCHAALLPHNRGSAPINWALIHGEEVTGNTMMWLSAEVDAGEIIAQEQFEISIFDTCKTLYEKVAITNASMLAKLLKQLKEGNKPSHKIPNITDEPILPRRHPKDGRINWCQDSKNIYNFIRALTIPYPGAFTYLNGKKWLLWDAAVMPLETKEIPGTILGTSFGFAKGGVSILVAAESGIVAISRVEDEEGKKYTGKALYKLNLRGTFSDE